MTTYDLMNYEPPCCGNLAEGVVGVQGKQGCRTFYYADENSQNTSYNVKSCDTMNIHNYFTGKQAACNARVSGSENLSVRIPSASYAFASCSYESDADYVHSMTPETIFIVPFHSTTHSDLYPLPAPPNQVGYMGFGVPKAGVYSVSYRVCFQEPVAVGARIRKNSETVEATAILPENTTTELFASTILRADAFDTFSLELITESSLTVTFKKYAGASLLISALRFF